MLLLLLFVAKFQAAFYEYRKHLSPARSRVLLTKTPKRVLTTFPAQQHEGGRLGAVPVSGALRAR